MKTKSRKRREALERQEKYDKLTDAQRLERLNKGNHRAVKERARKGWPSLEECNGS